MCPWPHSFHIPPRAPSSSARGHDGCGPSAINTLLSGEANAQIRQGARCLHRGHVYFRVKGVEEAGGGGGGGGRTRSWDKEG